MMREPPHAALTFGQLVGLWRIRVERCVLSHMHVMSVQLLL
jgi:hypothetical protein